MSARLYNDHVKWRGQRKEWMDRQLTEQAARVQRRAPVRLLGVRSEAFLHRDRSQEKIKAAARVSYANAASERNAATQNTLVMRKLRPAFKYDTAEKILRLSESKRLLETRRSGQAGAAKLAYTRPNSASSSTANLLTATWCTRAPICLKMKDLSGNMLSFEMPEEATIEDLKSDIVQLRATDKSSRGLAWTPIRSPEDKPTPTKGTVVVGIPGDFHILAAHQILGDVRELFSCKVFERDVEVEEVEPNTPAVIEDANSLRVLTDRVPPLVVFQKKTYLVEWLGPPSSCSKPLGFKRVQPYFGGTVELTDGSKFSNGGQAHQLRIVLSKSMSATPKAELLSKAARSKRPTNSPARPAAARPASAAAPAASRRAKTPSAARPRTAPSAAGDTSSKRVSPPSATNSAPALVVIQISPLQTTSAHLRI